MTLLASNWVDWLTGRDPDTMGNPRLQWTNFPESWGVFVLIAIVAAIGVGVFWLYRREQETCPRPIKMLLAGLRLAVLLFLVALFLKPSVFFQEVNELKRTIPFLRDGSLSIARSDTYRDAEAVERLSAATGVSKEQINDGQTLRSELLNAAFTRQTDAVENIREKANLQVIDFADGSRTRAVLPARSGKGTGSVAADPNGTEELIAEEVPPLEANGLGTDLWQALREVLEGGDKISAIVVASDFQHNGSGDPLELARRAAELDIPIYTVGLGDPQPPRNIEVSEVYVRNQAYPDEPFEVEALIQTNNLTAADGGPLQVTLQQQRVDPRNGTLGPAETIETRELPLPESGGRLRVDFEHVLGMPGKYVFSVQVEPWNSEINREDNRLASSELEVVDEQVRVLLISGLPSWDYQQVQRLLQRDQTISVSCWLQSMDESRPQEGDEPITRLPRTIEELGEYNVVMLMDPNPRDFDAEWIEALEQFCRNKAGGVLFMAGRSFTSEFVTLNRLGGIRDLLPVRFGDVDSIDTTQILSQATSRGAVQMEAIPFNLDHPVMSFRGDAAENQKIWASFPNVQWSFPAMSAKPTARVLLEDRGQIAAEGSPPLMVSGRFGAGSVLYLGFQGTWRWRRVGLQAQYFDRFWIQVVRFLVETRSLQGSRRGFIDAEQTEYELGDRITLMARVLDPQFQPATAPEVKALLQSAGGRTRELTLKRIPNQEGRYETSFVAQRIGNYDVTLLLAGDAAASAELVDPISFRVVAPSVESGAFWLNASLMNELAEQSGGQSFRLDQLDELAAALPRVSERITFNSPPKPIWDLTQVLRILAFLFPVALLTAEWAIRKWYKLM